MADWILTTTTMVKRPKRYLALLLALLITTSTFYTPAMAASVDSVAGSTNSSVVTEVSDEVAASPAVSAQASSVASVTGSASVESHAEPETTTPSPIQTVISTITGGVKSAIDVVTGNASDDAKTAEAQAAMDQADELTKLSSENRLIIDSTNVNVNGDTIQSGDTTIAVFETASDMEAAKAAMEADSRINTVEEDSVVAIQTDSAEEQPITDDIANQKATNQEVTSDVDATATTTETEGLTVAVIDTGVNGVENIDLTGEGTDDENGHGTRMAQLILSKSDNKAKILSIKAIGKDGTGKLSNIIVAVNMAIDNKVDIINMSFAMKDNANTETAKQVIQKAIDAGIKVVVAAGNQNDNAALYFPGNVPGVITVGAVDDKGVVRERSNKGNCINYFGYANYTSEAAAMVSGVLAAKINLNTTNGIWNAAKVTGNEIENGTTDGLTVQDIQTIENIRKVMETTGNDNNKLYNELITIYKGDSNNRIVESAIAVLLYNCQDVSSKGNEFYRMWKSAHPDKIDPDYKMLTLVYAGKYKSINAYFEDLLYPVMENSNVEIADSPADAHSYSVRDHVVAGILPKSLPSEYSFQISPSDKSIISYWGIANSDLGCWDWFDPGSSNPQVTAVKVYTQSSEAYNPSLSGAVLRNTSEGTQGVAGGYYPLFYAPSGKSGQVGCWVYNVGNYLGEQVDAKVTYYYNQAGIVMGTAISNTTDPCALTLNFYETAGYSASVDVYIGGVLARTKLGDTGIKFIMGDIDNWQTFGLEASGSGSIGAWASNIQVDSNMTASQSIATNQNLPTGDQAWVYGGNFASSNDFTNSSVQIGLKNANGLIVFIRPAEEGQQWALLGGKMTSSQPMSLQLRKIVLSESDFNAGNRKPVNGVSGVDYTKFKFTIRKQGETEPIETKSPNTNGWIYFSKNIWEGNTYIIEEIDSNGLTNRGGIIDLGSNTGTPTTTLTVKPDSGSSSGIYWYYWYNTEAKSVLRVVKNTYKEDGTTTSTKAGTFTVNLWKKDSSSESFVGAYTITTSGGTGYVDIPVEPGIYRVTEQDGSGNEVYSAGAALPGGWLYMNGNNSNVQVTDTNTSDNPAVVTISNKEEPTPTGDHFIVKIDEYTNGILTDKNGTQGDASGDLSLAGAQFRMVLDWGNGSKQTLETMTTDSTGKFAFSDHKVAVPSSFVSTTHAQNGKYWSYYEGYGWYVSGYYDDTTGCVSTCSASPTIYIEETQAPAGYRLNTEKISVSYSISNEGSGHAPNFQLTTGSASASKVYEEPYQGQITVQKFAHYPTKTENNKVWQSNTITDKPEIGATFRVWLKSAGSYDASEPEDRAMITIGTDGKGTTDKTLSGGTYCVQQYTGWPGTTKDASVYEVTIPKVTASTIGNYNTKTVGGKQVIDMYVSNTGGSNKASDLKKILNPFWLGQLTITKRDTYDNGLLNGFQFTLKEYDYTGRNTNTITLTTGSKNSDGSNASDGTVTFYGLRYGYRYTWQETLAAQGYRLDSNNRGWLSGDNSFTANSGAFWTASEASIMGTDASYNAIRNSNWMKSDGATRVADTHVPTSTTATLTQGSVIGANGTSGGLKVSVKDAKATATVYNKRRPGEIPITKVDENGNPVAGVTFCLQYSTDGGNTWNFITKRSVADDVSIGTTTANVTNYGTVGGCLTTGADGYVNFTGLRANTPADSPSGQPDVTYKLTEVGTDNGHYLLKQSIDVGALPIQYPANKINGAVEIGSSGTLSDYTTQNSSNYANRTKASKEFEWIDADGDGNVDTNERWFYTLPYEVTNSKMFQVPLTGGAGLPMLPVGVAVAMGGAAIMVFKRKKENGKEAVIVNPFDI